MNLKVVRPPRLKRDYVGKRVRSLRVMSNGYVQIPAGKVATVRSHSSRGADLVFDPCDCCGIQAKISQVKAVDFEFVEPDEQ